MAQRGRPHKETINWNEVAQVEDDGKPVQVTPPDQLKVAQDRAVAEMGYAGMELPSLTSVEPAPPDTPVSATGPSKEAMRLDEVMKEVNAALAASPAAPIPPSAEEIAAAEAILARARLADPDPPVSNKQEPIKLLEPEQSNLHVVDTGDVQIIASADRIEFMRSEGLLPEERFPSPKNEPRREQPARISLKVQQEQEAGRRTLAHHQARSIAYPKAERTAKEIAAEGQSVSVIDPDFHPLQALLRKPGGVPMGSELAQGGGATAASSAGTPVLHQPKGGGY